MAAARIAWPHLAEQFWNHFVSLRKSQSRRPVVAFPHRAGVAPLPAAAFQNREETTRLLAQALDRGDAAVLTHYLLGYGVYDSAHARFRSPDPTGREANSYNYAQGDPINESDPTGAYGWPDFAGDAVGGLFGLAVGVSFGTAISPYVTPVGGVIGGVAAGGCIKETVSNVVTNTINGQSTGWGESAGACAGGAVLGAL